MDTEKLREKPKELFHNKIIGLKNDEKGFKLTVLELFLESACLFLCLQPEESSNHKNLVRH